MIIDSEQNVSTEFNSSLYRLISLNKIIDDCNEYSRMCYVNHYNVEYLKLWNTSLKIFYREIKSKLINKEKKKINDMFKSSIKIGQVVETENTQEGRIKRINTTKFGRHWDLLDKIDSKLREFADKKGMLIKNDKEGGATAEDEL